jgi:UDP-glucose 4-epimerase
MVAVVAPRRQGKARATPRQTAVVVGGRGFLGRAIVAELTAAGCRVRVVDASAADLTTDPGSTVEHVSASILDRDALAGACADADAVYHLAGKLGTSELDADVEGAVEVNVLGTVRLLEAAADAGIRRVFYPTKPNVWENVYTITKHASERLAAFYHQSGRVEVASLRYFNAFGPGQSLGPIRKIVPTFAALALRGRPLQIFGDGEQVVDMVFSRDLGRLTVAFTNCESLPDSACDCGTGVGMTVNEVATEINALTGNTAGIRHVPMRSGEDPGTELVADTSEMLRRVGEFPFTPWRTGLEETLEWYAGLPTTALDNALRHHGLG